VPAVDGVDRVDVGETVVAVTGVEAAVAGGAATDPLSHEATSATAPITKTQLRIGLA